MRLVSNTAWERKLTCRPSYKLSSSWWLTVQTRLAGNELQLVTAITWKKQAGQWNNHAWTIKSYFIYCNWENKKQKTSTIILYIQYIPGLHKLHTLRSKLGDWLQSAPYPYNLYILKLVNEWQSFIHVICSHSETTVTQCRPLHYQELMSAADSVKRGEWS